MFTKVLQTMLCLLAASLSLGYAQTTLTMLRGEDEVMEAVIAAFEEENPDISIDSVEIVDVGYEAAMQRLLLSVAVCRCGRPARPHARWQQLHPHRRAERQVPLEPTNL